jgi:hypothetical protein
VFFLVSLQDLSLLDHLQGVDLVVFGLAYQDHLGVVALPDNTQRFEIVQRNLLARRLLHIIKLLGK